MYRYYTTKLNQYGIMEYPPLPIPDTVGHYGQNGIAFEGICGHFYGFVEYEKELPASDVANFDLVPGPSPSYYPIDEETARRAHEMMSFRDYQKGSKTWQYRVRVDEASMIADRQKKRIDPMYHEKVDRLLASFSRRLAENLNAESRIGTMCPSVLISGGSNFPVRKKQRQNEASERNMKEYQEIMGLISRICSVGTGGISSDEPQAIEKLKLKLEKLEKHQELMKAANAAIRMKDLGKGDAKLKELGYARTTPYPKGFAPTFYTYTLSYPEKRFIPSRVFVSSMGDLFGEWVPEAWIQEVFEACKRAPQHTYLFLTKNPKRYCDLANAGKLPAEPNFWYGTTVTGKGAPAFAESIHFNTFLSIEPLLEDIDPGLGSFGGVRWIIVGAMTGPGSREHQPRREWLEKIVEAAALTGAKVFMKDSLKGVWGPELIREHPEGMVWPEG